MMDATNVWNGHDPTLSSGHQDDFQQFLDMGMNDLDDGMTFDFQDFGNQHNGHLMNTENGDAMDTAMDGEVNMISGKEQTMPGQMLRMTSTAGMSIMASTSLDMAQHADQSMEALDAQIQFLQQRRLQQQQQVQMEEQRRRRQQQQQQFQFGQSRIIPPTPNSLEMHSQNSQYYPQAGPQQQAMYERYQLRLKEQEVC